MKSFLVHLLRFSLIGGIPFLFITGTLYLVLDPFKVVQHYDSFIDSGAKGAVTLDKDYVSTQTFINNSPRTAYNSFIFGNSRSIFYEVSDWKKHLPQTANCFHFDASGESLDALTKKVAFIDRKGNDIQHILLVLDYSVLLQDEARTDHIGIIHPALVNHANIFNFHSVFFFAFLNPKFMYAFLDYKISGKVKPYMKNDHLLDDRERTYDASINEMQFDYFEKLIRENKFYTPERLTVFYQRDTTTQHYSAVSINKNQMAMLTSIHDISKKHHTDVKVVISPLYDQVKLNEKDLAYLKNLFGAENVFDFSGINRFTNDYRNYYEDSHYRPHVTRELLNILYEQPAH